MKLSVSREIRGGKDVGRKALKNNLQAQMNVQKKGTNSIKEFIGREEEGRGRVNV